MTGELSEAGEAGPRLQEAETLQQKRSPQGRGRQPSKIVPGEPRLLVFTPLCNPTFLSSTVNWTE